MINFVLKPSNGSLDAAKSVDFIIEGASSGANILQIENLSCRKICDIKELSFGSDRITGVVDLGISPDYSGISISLAAYLKKNEEQSLIDIGMSSYRITDEICEYNDIKSFNISPQFFGVSDLATITASGDPSTKRVFSINNKIFKINIGETGEGSFSFKGEYFLSDSDKVNISEFAIYEYLGQSFDNKVLTGKSLTILPDNIMAHADIDPRCDMNSDDYYPPGTWTLPQDCISAPEDVIPAPLAPVSPNLDFATGCIDRDILLNENICKIYSRSVTKLNNGTFLHAYLSPDKSYQDSSDSRFNKNRVFLSRVQSSASHSIVAAGQVSVGTKSADEDFSIYVSEDIYDSVSADSSGGNYVIFWDKIFGYQSFNIINKYVDEYTGYYVLVGDKGQSQSVVGSVVLCVDAVFYDKGVVPSTYLPFDYLPFLKDNLGNYLQILSVRVGSNAYYSSVNGDCYVYIVAEARVNGKSQLFLYSFKMGTDSSSEVLTFGWKQLTFEGNNCCPEMKTDKYDNLHICWESDRSGVKEVYYGCLGKFSSSSTIFSSSSCIDKYARFYHSGDNYFNYVNENIVENAEGSSSTIPYYSTEDLVSGDWDIFSSEGGSVSETASDVLSNLAISGNILTDEAIAFSSLQIIQDDHLLSDSYPYNQYNYQVSFDFSSSLTQESDLVSGGDYVGEIIDEGAMDILFRSWIEDFTKTIDTRIPNQPVYSRDGNIFVVGRQDNVYDRIVPIFGSYNKGAISSDFNVKISEEDGNVKDFVLALMLEKSYFKANNIESEYEFVERGNSIESYVEGYEEKIFTGMAKWCILVRNLGADDSNNYQLVKEISNPFSIYSSSHKDIIFSYSSITNDEKLYILNAFDSLESNNYFAGKVMMMSDYQVDFSHSFISEMNEDDNYFDLGFGIPYGGYYYQDRMISENLAVYDDVDMSLYFSNIEITSPSYRYNNDVLSVDPYSNDLLSLFVLNSPSYDIPSSALEYEKTSAETDIRLSLGLDGRYDIIYQEEYQSTENFYYSASYEISPDVDSLLFYFKNYSLSSSVRINGDGSEIYDKSFSTDGEWFSYNINVEGVTSIEVLVESESENWEYIIYFGKDRYCNSFSQIPLSFRGTSQSPFLDIGSNNDVNIVWESNQEMYWNIFYSSSCNKLLPFRNNYQITNTESNSLHPVISMNDNHSGLICWHDNRKGSYNIYGARILNNSCGEEVCQQGMREKFSDIIENCKIEIEYDLDSEGLYMLTLNFYEDPNLEYFYKDVSINNDNKDKWFVDGESVISYIEYDEDGEVVGVNLMESGVLEISYLSDKDDGLFDRVLYYKLSVGEIE